MLTGTGERINPERAKLLLFSWLWASPGASQEQGTGALCTEGCQLLLGLLESARRTSKWAAEEREEDECQTFLHHAVRDHANRQSLLLLRAPGCQGHHHGAALKIQPTPAQYIFFPPLCTITHYPGHRCRKPARFPCFDFGLCEYWPPVSPKQGPFHTDIGMAKMWTYLPCEGWWNIICFCKKYQGHAKHRNAIPALVKPA